MAAIPRAESFQEPQRISLLQTGMHQSGRSLYTQRAEFRKPTVRETSSRGFRMAKWREKIQRVAERAPLCVSCGEPYYYVRVFRKYSHFKIHYSHTPYPDAKPHCQITLPRDPSRKEQSAAREKLNEMVETSKAWMALEPKYAEVPF